MNHLGAYEKQAMEEISRWRDGGLGLLAKVLETAVKPIGWILEKTVSEKAQQTLQQAVLGALEMLK